jgi:prepilin-type N-terminal cleavage/methylation domain-containing protein/prepilin-type processing-associated H-X9-DG protein
MYNYMRIAGNTKMGRNATGSQARAFTLVELLVVISVIALLMGILVPVLGKARASASRTTCKSNLRQIGVAFRAYLDDNRDIMPPACDYPWYITDTNDPGYRPPITKFLGPLLQEPKVFICKADIDKKYYLRVGGTSYQYHGQGPGGLGGQSISSSFPAQMGVKERNINVMNDFDTFHGTAGKSGARNYLYADWHVGDLTKQD